MKNASPLRISRVDPPLWIYGDVEHGAYYHQLGGQVEWHFATPWAFRALASPSTLEPILSAPKEHMTPSVSAGHAHRAAYWTSLLYLLCYRLGWAIPAQGVAAWRAAGYPDDDPTLRLVKAIWVNDRRIEDLLDWAPAWHRPFQPILAELGWQEIAQTGPTPGNFLRSGRSESELGPGGLHLEPAGAHTTTPLQSNAHSKSRLLRTSPDHRRAVMVTDDMVGWYASLARLGGTLPDLGISSWRVDVVATPVGHLGTYRRSTLTGLWFSGRHSVHVLGN